MLRLNASMLAHMQLMKVAYDMYNKGFFILITENKCYDLCEMDEPNHITVLRTFNSARAAKMYAKKNNIAVIYE